MIYSWLWLIPVLPLAGFALMFGITYENKRISAWIGIATAAAADVLSLIFLFNELAKPQHIQNAFRVHPVRRLRPPDRCPGGPPRRHDVRRRLQRQRPDPGLLAGVHARRGGLRALLRLHLALHLLDAAAGAVPNFFQTYVGWELVGVCSYLLIGHYFKRPAAAAAAKKAFIVTRFGDFPFLVGIGYIFFRFHDLDFYNLAPLYTAGKVGSLGLFVMAMMVFSGAVGKSASSRSTSGCRTPWRARRRSRP